MTDTVRLYGAWEDFKRSGQLFSQEATALAEELDKVAAHMAKSTDERISLGADKASWKNIEVTWKRISSTGDTHSKLTLSLSRFIRNLVAQEPANQARAQTFESDICGLIHRLTSFGSIDDSSTFPHLRMSIQLLSNMITSNSTLADTFWAKHCSQPEESNTFLRILQSPDPIIAQYCFILTINALHASRSNILHLLKPAPSSGRRILVSLLDKLEKLSEKDEVHDTAAFDIGFQLFEIIFQNCDIESFWIILEMEDSVITPPRIVFLKLLDAYLEAEKTRAVHSRAFSFLVPSFARFCQYASRSVEKSTAPLASQSLPSLTGNITPGDERSLRDLDLILPRVCQAIILSVQCLLALSLGEEDDSIRKLLKRADDGETGGIAEEVIELLRQLDTFLPRVMFGKILNAPPVASTGRVDDTTGFAYLKRDLVRLLGVIVFEDMGMQNRIRECGGIPVIMNLCVTDERNPYLREHALFTLRNTLQGNMQNQAVVDAIQPSGYWDREGVLRDLPNAVRK